MSDTLYSYDDLAKRFGKSKSWLYAHVKSGHLIPTKYGRRTTRFSERAVADFVGAAWLPKDFDDFSVSDQVIENTVIASHQKP